MMAALGERCHCSIMPLACGWYAVVRVLWLSMSLTIASNINDSNWVSLSVVMILGAPNRVIHVLENALVTVSADVSGIGAASGHLVVLSIIVR